VYPQYARYNGNGDVSKATSSAAWRPERQPEEPKGGLGRPSQVNHLFAKLVVVSGSPELGEKELSLLRTRRNQAVMAFRQSERG
jgi:hypothetical protein